MFVLFFKISKILFNTKISSYNYSILEPGFESRTEPEPNPNTWLSYRTQPELSNLKILRTRTEPELLSKKYTNPSSNNLHKKIQYFLNISKIFLILSFNKSQIFNNLHYLFLIFSKFSPKFYKLTKYLLF